MIYCFKMLRKLNLLNIFFLHYGISLVVGSAIIAGFFLLGGGLQFYSIVVLCYMYTEPAFIMLRRNKMYSAKAAIRDTSLSAEEKAEIALDCLFFKPMPDKYFCCNFILAVSNIIFFFMYNDIMLYYISNETDYYVTALVLIIPITLCTLHLFGFIKDIKKEVING